METRVLDICVLINSQSHSISDFRQSKIQKLIQTDALKIHIDIRTLNLPRTRVPKI